VPAHPDALRRLADVIRDARNAQGWSQDKLAEESGTSRPTVQRYENGKTADPEPAPLRAIFRSLGLDVRDIPIILGYVTEDEMKQAGTRARQIDTPDLQEVIAALQDPDVDLTAKQDMVEMIRLAARQARARRVG
jgi:transcriptional regulator with XRE-family HTH domain